MDFNKLHKKKNCSVFVTAVPTTTGLLSWDRHCTSSWQPGELECVERLDTDALTQPLLQHHTDITVLILNTPGPINH